MRQLWLYLFLVVYSFAHAQYIRPYISMDIPVRDGAKLAADLYTNDTLVPKPVILFQTPYNKVYYRFKGTIPSFGELPFDTVNYNYVAVDWRGFYGSAAFAKAGYDRGLDGYDIIEWIATQPWSNGKIGTAGSSALGMIQFQTAKHRPPHHICAAPLMIDYKTTYDKFFPGGCFMEEHYSTYDSLGLPGSDIALAHPTYDIYWKAVERLTDYPDSIAIPLFMLTGWYDHFPDGIIRAFKDLRERSFPDVRDKHKLVVGPWLHTQGKDRDWDTVTDPNLFNIRMETVTRFLDYYLRGVDNGYDKEPVTTCYNIKSGDDLKVQTTWQEATANGDTLTLNLAYPDVLSKDSFTGHSERTFPYVPQDFSPSIGSSTFSPYLLHGPQDISQTIEKRNDLLTFTTDLFDESVLIRGSIQVYLTVKTDKTDTDFAVRLCDVDQTGHSIIITDAIKRLRFRDGYETEKPATPGEAYQINIPLRNLSLTIQRFHRLRIDITSSNYPRFNLNPNSGMALYKPSDTLSAINTVILNSGASLLKVPITKQLSVIEHSDETTFSCYPNPAKQTLTVRVIQGADSGVELVDALGRVVAKSRLNENGASFDVSGLPEGVYFVRIGAMANKIIVAK
jgi:predicted acyl esterase